MWCWILFPWRRPIPHTPIPPKRLLPQAGIMTLSFRLFTSFSLSVFGYKAAVNLHSWNHFPSSKKSRLLPNTWAPARIRECPACIWPLAFLWCGPFTKNLPILNATKSSKSQQILHTLYILISFKWHYWNLSYWSWQHNSVDTGWLERAAVLIC